jgi:hypothetical protein
MRILTKEQLIKEPIGTVYCTCIDCCFTGELEIKQQLISDDGIAWYSLDVAPWMKTCLETFSDYKQGEEIPTEENCVDDATYNYDDKTMYAVFSKEEVKGMIERLNGALNGKYDG